MKKLLTLHLFIFYACSPPTESDKPPTVDDITIITKEDVPATFTMTGNDPEGKAITFTVSKNPEHGTVTTSGAAGTYTPKLNFNGVDSLEYTASDGKLISSIGKINVVIDPVDDNPNTMDVVVSTDEDTPVEIELKADEVDGDQIIFNIKSEPLNGAVIVNGDKAIYTPNENYYGTDSFSFEAVDDLGSLGKKILNVANATITINPINDAPVVDEINAVEYNTKDITLTLTATDVENDNVSFEIVDGPTSLTASISGNILTINKISTFWGLDSLTYRGYDGSDYGKASKVNIRFKRYINYKRSSYELKHSDYWFEGEYFRNTFNDHRLGPEHGTSDADFNGDGYTDVLIARTWETNERFPLSLFLGTANKGVFTKDESLIKNNIGTIFMRKELIGDFNGDNVPDVFFIDSGTHAVGFAHESIMLSNDDGTFTFSVLDQIRPGGGTHGGASADIDSDGDIDVVVSYSGEWPTREPSTYFLINDGKGKFTYDESIMNDNPSNSNDIGYNFWELEFYDLNKDNMPDLVADGFQAGRKDPPQNNVNRVFWNNGGKFSADTLNGAFSDLPIDFSMTPFPNENPQVLDYCFGDLDGDGNIEVIGSATWPIYDRGQIYIWSHNGDYKYFDATKDLIEGSYFDGSGDDPAYRIRLQDIDGNGSVDLFRDIKDSHNGYYALRWEWNGSKFIPKF
tara:strand:- start:130 stop:2184 length:2055 start_codon:yes stop_codon:yes gene_type:complete